MHSYFQSTSEIKRLGEGGNSTLHDSNPFAEITNARKDGDFSSKPSIRLKMLSDKRCVSCENSSCCRPVTSLGQYPQKSPINHSLGSGRALKTARHPFSPLGKATATPRSSSKVPKKKPWTPTSISSSNSRDNVWRKFKAISTEKKPNTAAPVFTRASTLQKHKEHDKACVPYARTFQCRTGSQEAANMKVQPKHVLENVQAKVSSKLTKGCHVEGKPVGKGLRRLSQVIKSEEELLEQNKEYERQLQDLHQLFAEKNCEVESFHNAGMMLKKLFNKEAEELKLLKAAYPTALKEITHLREVCEKQEHELKNLNSALPALKEEVTYLTRFRELCGKQEQELKGLQSAVPALKEQITYLKSRLRTMELEIVKEKSRKVLMTGVGIHGEQASTTNQQSRNV